MFLAGILKQRRHDRWREGGRAARASSPTAAPTPICCMPASRRSGSCRTTCARSSWPRRRCTPARGCSWIISGVDRVERITLAGAFGSHIDVKYAMILGLIPDCDLAKVSAAGNAAGTGARIALLNRGARAEIEQVVRADREDRDRDRAALSGALRRRDGDPARERALSQPRQGGDLPAPSTAGARPASDAGAGAGRRG